MIGGWQAETQLLAISQVLPRIDEVKVFDKQKDVCLRYVQEMGAKLNANIRLAETTDETAEADIVVTTTPSRKPIVKKEHIRPGTHINATGADAKGKQELEVDLLMAAKVIVDDIEQAVHSGEINVPLSDGLIEVDDIHGTLGERLEIIPNNATLVIHMHDKIYGVRDYKVEKIIPVTGRVRGD